MKDVGVSGTSEGQNCADTEMKKAQEIKINRTAENKEVITVPGNKGKIMRTVLLTSFLHA